MPIDNTSHDMRDPANAHATIAMFLAVAERGGTDVLSEATERFISDMEEAGQRQVAASSSLPTEMHPSEEEFTALGFALGEVHPGDPLFRTAQLPEGWTRRATDHDFYTKLLDEHGRPRATVFYKAAFYGRCASVRLTQPQEYARQCVASGGEPLLDEWCTAARVLEQAHAETAHAWEMVEFWQGRAEGEELAREEEHYRKKIALWKPVIAHYLPLVSPQEGGTAPQ